MSRNCLVQSKWFHFPLRSRLQRVSVGKKPSGATHPNRAVLVIGRCLGFRRKVRHRFYAIWQTREFTKQPCQSWVRALRDVDNPLATLQDWYSKNEGRF